MKIIKFMLDKFYAKTFMTIIGFTVGSILVLIPDFENFNDFFLGLIFASLSFIIVMKSVKIKS